MVEKEEDKIAKHGGLIVFALGIVLLCLVFYFAYSAFKNPDSLASFSRLIPVESTEGPFGGITKTLGYFVAIALLFVMGSIGGKIVKYGIEMHRTKS